jgi:hypothetical protein
MQEIKKLRHQSISQKILDSTFNEFGNIALLVKDKEKNYRLIEKPVWLVEIVMPKSLMSDIRTGSVELEDQDIDLSELDQDYEQDLYPLQYSLSRRCLN